MIEKKLILKLFSQPIFKYKVSNYEKINNELINYIYNLYKNDPDGVKKSNIDGWHSKSFDLNEKENVPNKFFSLINHHIEDVFTKYGWIYDITKVKCTSMWAIINKKGNFNIEHTHSNNYLSAAYYVKAPDNCGNFKVTNPNSINRNFFPKSNKSTEFNAKTATIEIKEGDLLIFPAYLPHSVEENKSNDERIIVSFNLDIIR